MCLVLIWFGWFDLFGAFLCCGLFSWLLKVFCFGMFDVFVLVWFSFERRDKNFFETCS